jgi:adenylosuccinate lyase
MAVHPIDYRYGSEEMREIFDEQTRLEKMLRVEVALVQSLVDLGKAPRVASREIENRASKVKLERVKEIEGETKHDVMAMVKALTEQCSPETGKYVHATATSYDIVDTALAMQMRDALKLTLKRGNDLLKTLLLLSEKYRKQVMVGRTHGQHATPITLGFKFANYADKLGDDLLRVKGDYESCTSGKFSGAVGSYSAQSLFDVEGELEARVMKKLGLKAATISTQVVARENMARILCDLAILATTVDQIAREIRNLQRTEILEVTESFGKKQVGSSTMAQKRNPINCENICSNAKVVRSCVYPAMENIALDHERDLTNSAAERSILPTAFILTDEILTRMDKVLKGVQVFPENMKRNLELTRGTIMSEAVMTALVKRGMGRQEAHELLRKTSMECFSTGKHLKELLVKDRKVTKYLSEKEISDAMNYVRYTGICEKKAMQVTKKWKGGV